MKTVILLALVAACDTRMIDQPKQLPYGDVAMRTPPAGTVPRAESTASDPPPDGRARYAIACAACHGLDGRANTPVAHAMQRRRPPSLRDPRIVALPRAQLDRVIALGYGLMPSYAALLSPADRRAVADYVTTELQR
jgi:mono/diheme cytochrome c family protein